jgi:hypothetical protein
MSKKADDGKKCCGTCRHWRRGDLTPKGIGNVGQCAVLMPRTAEFYGDNEFSPFWAQDISYRTADYEGKGCGAWQQQTKK